jgi:hypothetical protein
MVGKEVVMTTTLAQDSQVYSMVDGPQLMRLKIMRAMCQILRQHARETLEDEEDKEEEAEEEAKEEWGMGIIEQII